MITIIGRHGLVRHVRIISALLTLMTCPDSSAQSAVVQPIMREKLANAQQLLEGVLAENYDLMDRYGARIGRITLKEILTWQARADPEYLRDGRRFLAAVVTLRSAVSARNPEQISSAYRTLLASCTGCHSYVRASKPAQGRPEP